MLRAALWLCGLGFLPVSDAASIRTDWAFAWDPHPQAAVIDHFDLEICIPTAGCTITHIPGGTTTQVRNVIVSAIPPGDGTAVLRACTAKNECSANSNIVTLDRSAPLPPTHPQIGDVWH